MDWSRLPTDDPWATARAVLRILRTSEEPWTGITSVELDIVHHLIDFLWNEVYTEKDEAYCERCRECIRVLGMHHQLVVTDWFQIPIDDPWELIPEVLRIMRSSEEPWRGIELLKPSIIPNLTKLLNKQMQITKDETYREACRRCLQGLGERRTSVTMDWSDMPYYNPWASIREVLYLLRVSDQPWTGIESVPSDTAQQLLDLLQDELDAEPSDGLYRTTCMKCLRVVAERHRLPPTSLICRNVERDGSVPVRSGGLSDYWKGTMGEKYVCLQVFRLYTVLDEDGTEEIFTRYWVDALVWRQLRHPNILPFLGVTEDLVAATFCLISPWMGNGDIISFLQRYPSHDRLNVIRQIAQGIRYLHELDPPIVHGDIKGANILVNDELHCCLADVSLVRVVGSQSPASSEMERRGSIQWLPPELMDTSLYDHSYATATDIYSFGCTIIEIYTGKAPFAHIKRIPALITEVLIKKKKPPRPSLDELPSEDIWNLIETSLSTLPAERPTATTILHALRAIQTSYSDGRRANWVATSASSTVELIDDVHPHDLTPEDRQRVHKYVKTRLDTILTSTSPSMNIRHVPLEFAQPMVDILQAELDSAPTVNNHRYRSVRVRCLYALGNVHGVIPASLLCANIQRDGEYPVAGGGFSEVFRGTTSSHETKVCLKRLRVVISDDSASLMKMLCHEALVWRQLQHPNILCLLGVNFDMSKKFFWLILPWLENGNVRDFLRIRGDRDRFQSVLEIAEGMKYLHEFDPPVVHSDIKGANILVADDGRCVLTDFGIMVVVETHAPGTTTRGAGSLRWMPPEMLDPELFNARQPLTSRDVYSFGCTIIEVHHFYHDEKR